MDLWDLEHQVFEIHHHLKTMRLPKEQHDLINQPLLETIRGIQKARHELPLEVIA